MNWDDDTTWCLRDYSDTSGIRMLESVVTGATRDAAHSVWVQSRRIIITVVPNDQTTNFRHDRRP